MVPGSVSVLPLELPQQFNQLPFDFFGRRAPVRFDFQGKACDCRHDFPVTTHSGRRRLAHCPRHHKKDYWRPEIAIEACDGEAEAWTMLQAS